MTFYDKSKLDYMKTHNDSLAGFVAPKKRIYTESNNQQAGVKWWAVACKGYGLPEIALIAHPNQAWRTPANGARMKREGARKGTLDMQLTVARGGYHGLWIENKDATGRLTPEQVEHRCHLERQGYCFRLCRSLDDLVKAITTYLTNPSA